MAKESTKPLFLIDQFKVVTKGMQGEPVLPTDEELLKAIIPKIKDTLASHNEAPR